MVKVKVRIGEDLGLGLGYEFGLKVKVKVRLEGDGMTESKMSCPRRSLVLRADAPSRLCCPRGREVTAPCKKRMNYFGQRSAGTPHTHSTDCALNHLLNDGLSGATGTSTKGHETSASSKASLKESSSEESISLGPLKGSYSLSVYGRRTCLTLDKSFCERPVLWL